MRRASIAIVLALVWAVPATACYNGPMPLQFVDRTAKLSYDDVSALEWQLAARRDNFPHSRLLVIFYSPQSEAVLNQRRRAIRDYLLGKGLHADDLAIEVTAKKPPLVLLSEWTHGKMPTASVELSMGGCH